MSFAERALMFSCAGERLVGVLTEPRSPGRTGVLVIVGGPQYRAGHHRQFVLLARRLAREGFPVMRFDHRGMGDATGPLRSFDEVVPDLVPDISAAVGAFRAAAPHVDHLVLWGLCDAAASALTYWAETRDARVAGMVLLNPWVRTAETLAAAQIKHYYRRRLFQKAFRTKLARGDVQVARSLAQAVLALGQMCAARRRRTGATSLRDRMADGLEAFAGPVLFVLSEHDLIAHEFQESARADARWRGLLERSNVEQRTVADADHTFSSAQWRGAVEAMTLEWLTRALPPRSAEHAACTRAASPVPPVTSAWGHPARSPWSLWPRAASSLAASHARGYRR